MNITSFAIAARELSATLIIAILLPCMVHRGVKILMPEPQSVRIIKEIERVAQTHEQKECLKMWEEKKVFTVFCACIVIGVLALIIGYCISNSSLTTGLLLGGGLTIFTGYISYASHLDDLFIFISMLLAFIATSFALYNKKQQ